MMASMAIHKKKTCVDPHVGSRMDVGRGAPSVNEVVDQGGYDG